MLSIDYRIRSVFREVFDREDMEICDEMTAKDVPEWDSLAQVKLIIGIEEEFGMKFTTKDVAEMSCVGDVKKIIINKGVKG
jgi:acyl carrier protein